MMLQCPRCEQSLMTARCPPGAVVGRNGHCFCWLTAEGPCCFCWAKPTEADDQDDSCRPVR